MFGIRSMKRRLFSFLGLGPRLKTSSVSATLPLIVTESGESTTATNDLAELQGLIATWADQIIPDRTPESTLAKLLEELGELIASDRMNDPQELADVAILVLDLFTIQGIDLSDAVRKKMMINNDRHWTVQDNGAARHV